MQKHKAITEQILPNHGSSFRVKRFDVKNKDGAPFWHFHPELQLVYVKSGSGKRHIGNHLSYFRNGDLVLIGPNLPHYGLTDQLKDEHFEIIVQFKKDFLGKEFFEKSEMQNIKQLFDRSKFGMAFSKKLRAQLGEKIEGLYHQNNLNRLLDLLEILQILANSTEYELLNAKDLALEVNLQENEKIRQVYSFVRTNFHENISLKDISDEVHMTVPAFCRYFKKQSGKTFTQFVNEFRIIHSCKLLIEKEDSIAGIAFDAGFNNFSHFNRSFKKVIGKNPTEYRKDFRNIRI